MDFETISRRESRKRRRLSERRRLFSNRLGQLSQMSLTNNNSSDSAAAGAGEGSPRYSRSDSPIGGDQQRISMKIQFHITVAPDNEPLILADNSAPQTQDRASSGQQAALAAKQPSQQRQASIGEQIQEKLNLSRQNSATNGNSRRSRQQRLMAMHKSSTNTTTTTSGGESSTVDTPLSGATIDDDAGVDLVAQSEDNLLGRCDSSRKPSDLSTSPPLGMPPLYGSGGGGREAGARSSTITGGMADEATMRFLQRTSHDQGTTNQAAATRGPQQQPQRYNSAANLSTASTRLARDRERIYFKRDGQRFGHEFTLKLAVDRTYRCLLKVRPLIPLQSISIQGHHVLFVDCSQQQRTAGGSAPSSTGNLSSVALVTQQRLRSGSAAGVPSRHSSQPVNDAYLNKHHLQNHHHQQYQPHDYHHNHHQQRHNHNHRANYHHHHHNPQRSHPMAAPAPGTGSRPGLYHAQTTDSLVYPAAQAAADSRQVRVPSSCLLELANNSDSGSLYRQQQNQMMRHFAASYCSSSNSHLGNQLIYMFDWPASRFEVNKNKNRTEIQTVLKFQNGQILSLPLQVKFYQSDCKQHLEWGSQLHFIDYDCQINQLGQISVDRIQYY